MERSVVAWVAVVAWISACSAGNTDGTADPYACGHDGESCAHADGSSRSDARDAGTISHDSGGSSDSGSSSSACSTDAGMYGVVPTGCACVSGQTRSCYPGDVSRVGVGVCRAGTQSCSGDSEIGEWGACTGAVLPGPEVCGNGMDDNCDGHVDEGCPCLRASSTPWQMWRAPSPMCWGTTFTRHGDPGEYALSTVPPETDPGWTGESSSTIDFDEMSRLCGVCDCLAGGDYTYFQTTFEIPPGYTITSLVVSVGWVDDGVRITVFNDANPSGVVDPGSYAYLGGGSTSDLARYIVPGHNRIVLTHVDDCCSTRGMTGVTIRVNGGALMSCM